MQSYSQLITEALDAYSPRGQYERILQLIENEKRLVEAEAILNAWEVFRKGISDGPHSHLLKWCPSPLPAKS